MTFNTWIDTLIEEKGIDRNSTFKIVKNNEIHIFELGHVIDCIKLAPTQEKKEIKYMLVKIDCLNCSITDYLKHLAKALI